MQSWQKEPLHGIHHQLSGLLVVLVALVDPLWVGLQVPGQLEQEQELVELVRLKGV